MNKVLLGIVAGILIGVFARKVQSLPLCIPLPSLDVCGSKLTPVVARTPSRLSREKCFNSAGEAGGWRELVHALIASDTTRARDLFFMLPPSGLTTQLVG